MLNLSLHYLVKCVSTLPWELCGTFAIDSGEWSSFLCHVVFASAEEVACIRRTTLIVVEYWE